MFNVQGSEIIIIVILALIVLGPEKLPEAIRKFSHFYGEAKKMSNGFQSELRNALDEPMRELQATADLVRQNADLRDVAVSPIKRTTASMQDATPAKDTTPANETTPAKDTTPANETTPDEAAPASTPANWGAPKPGTAADPDQVPPVDPGAGEATGA